MNKSLWLGDVKNPDLHIQAIEILQHLRNRKYGSPGEVLWYVRDYFGTDDGITVRRGPPWEYLHLLVRNGDTMLMFVDGAQVNEHRERIVNEWTESDPFSATLGCSRYAQAEANRIVENVPSAFFNGVKYLRVFGYSFGGNIGAVLTAFCQWTQGGVNSMSVSYGSPKAGNEKFRDLMQRYGSIRFMLEDDNIPAFPPKPSDAPGTTILVWGGINWNRLGAWCHVPVGWALNRGVSYSLERRELMPLPTPTLFPTLTTVLGWDNTVAEGHDLDFYRTWWTIFKAQTTSFVVADPVPVDRPQVVTPTLRTRIRNEGTTIVRADANNPNGVLRNRQITPVRAGDPTRYRAYRTKEGFWLVAKGSDVEGIGPGKRSAKSQARAFNRAVKKQRGSN